MSPETVVKPAFLMVFETPELTEFLSAVALVGVGGKVVMPSPLPALSEASEFEVLELGEQTCTLNLLYFGIDLGTIKFRREGNVLKAVTTVGKLVGSL